MGFRLSVKGQENEILLDKESILDVKYISDFRIFKILIC